jgi:hypothetical protein
MQINDLQETLITNEKLSALNISDLEDSIKKNTQKNSEYQNEI